MRCFTVFFALVLISCLSPGPTGAQPITAQQAADTQLDGFKLLDSAMLGSRFASLGIDFVYVKKDTTLGRYFCGRIARGTAVRAAQTIAGTLLRLPEKSIRKLGLKHIILGNHLKAIQHGLQIGGFPVPALKSIMLSVGEMSNQSSYLQYLVLHELYHFMEFRFQTCDDPEWQKRFGSGYANSYNAPIQRALIGSGRRGFLNTYAESFPHEERAEIFATLLLEPAKLAGHIKRTSDVTLKDKTLYVITKCENFIGFHIPVNIKRRVWR